MKKKYLAITFVLMLLSLTLAYSSDYSEIILAAPTSTFTATASSGSVSWSVSSDSIATLSARSVDELISFSSTTKSATITLLEPTLDRDAVITVNGLTEIENTSFLEIAHDGKIVYSAGSLTILNNDTTDLLSEPTLVGGTLVIEVGGFQQWSMGVTRGGLLITNSLPELSYFLVITLFTLIVVVILVKKFVLVKK